MGAAYLGAAAADAAADRARRTGRRVAAYAVQEVEKVAWRQAAQGHPGGLIVLQWQTGQDGKPVVTAKAGS